jgi:hypothetical protein
MGTCPGGIVDDVVVQEVTITEAAIRTCGRLVALMAGRITTHAYRDGGLICEDRTSRARPRMWRITPDGAVLSDCSYNFTRQAFMRVPLPQEASA